MGRSSKPSLAADPIRPRLSERRHWSINTQLLLAVNVPLALALAVLLTLDYRREMTEAVAQKHASLNEEAMIIYHGIYFLAQNDRPEALQRFIDSVCGHMQESQSPGHHIAVRWQGGLIQAKLHQPGSSDLLQTIQQAADSPDYLATLENETLVVGRFSGRGVDVFVSEYTTALRQSIQKNILFHLVSLVVLAIAAAAIVNPPLWRMVARPVRKLSSTVARIATGQYNVAFNGFHTRELHELAIAIQAMTESLASNERDRRSQMAQARRIQEHLLPGAVGIPGLAVAHVFAAADAVAGDYFDLIQLPDQTWLVCVADVTGHGIPAALGSVILKTVLQSAAEHHVDPGQILLYVNQRLIVLLPDQFVSIFVGRWNSATTRLDYASAGHEPGLLLTLNNEPRPLNATGPLIGITDAAVWETEFVELRNGERILLTTDGVAEAIAPDLRLFGRAHLAEIAADALALPPEAAVRSIAGAVHEHQAGELPTDDLTVVLLESRPHALAFSASIP